MLYRCLQRIRVVSASALVKRPTFQSQAPGLVEIEGLQHFMFMKMFSSRIPHVNSIN